MQIQGNDKTLNLFPESNMPSFCHRSSVEAKIFDKCCCLFGIHDMDILKWRHHSTPASLNGRTA